MPKRNRRYDYSVIGWNVHIRQTPAHVRHELSQLIAAHHPDAIALQEASKLYGHLDGLGYHVLQQAPVWRGRGIDEAANTALLVRDDHHVRDDRVVHMRTRWDGPVHGWPHPPRQYQRAVVENKHGRRLFAIQAIHLPFGAAAQAEALDDAGDWLAGGTGAHPRLVVGDWNRRKARVRAAMKHHSRGIKVVGQGIDLMAARNVRPVRAKRLGKHGSDHHAMLYRFGDPTGKKRKHKHGHKKKGGTTVTTKKPTLTAPAPKAIWTRHHGGYQNPVGGVLRLHSTVSACKPGGAKAIAKYFQTTDRSASAHYVVDCSESYRDAVYQCVPDHKVSWDCGWNPPGISIEMCEYPSPTNKRRWDDAAHRQLEANTVELAAQLCAYYKIRPWFVGATALRRGTKGVTTHAQVAKAYPRLTTHWDPGAWRRFRFMRALRKRVKEIEKETGR